ncbi:MAG TPA: hypothetical protein VEA61_12950 [Allosphingosinicella sp.]|nr:hypothetical protein [Allosphingosinicella sp.]
MLSATMLLTLWVLSPLKSELVDEPDAPETREGAAKGDGSVDRPQPPSSQ